MEVSSAGPTSLKSNCTDADEKDDELQEEEEEELRSGKSDSDRFTALVSPKELAASRLIYSKEEEKKS